MPRHSEDPHQSMQEIDLQRPATLFSVFFLWTRTITITPSLFHYTRTLSRRIIQFFFQKICRKIEVTVQKRFYETELYDHLFHFPHITSEYPNICPIQCILLLDKSIFKSLPPMDHPKIWKIYNQYPLPAIIFSGQVRSGVTRPEGQVGVNS